MSPVLARNRNATLSVLAAALISVAAVLAVTALSGTDRIGGQQCPPGQQPGYQGCTTPTNPPGVTQDEVYPNEGGCMANAINAVTLTGGGTGEEISGAIQTRCGRPVIIIWYLLSGQWQYYYPAQIGISTFTEITAPVASLYVLLG